MKRLTIEKANEILSIYKPQARILRVSNNTLYNIRYSKNGKVYPLNSSFNLYDILIEIIGFVDELEEYRRFYRPTLEEMTGREETNKQEREKELDEFFGM